MMVGSSGSFQKFLTDEAFRDNTVLRVVEDKIHGETLIAEKKSPWTWLKSHLFYRKSYKLSTIAELLSNMKLEPNDCLVLKSRIDIDKYQRKHPKDTVTVGIVNKLFSKPSQTKKESASSTLIGSQTTSTKSEGITSSLLLSQTQEKSASPMPINNQSASINLGSTDFPPPKFPPTWERIFIEEVSGTEEYIALKNPQSGNTLVLLKGSITQDHGMKIDAVVNAANSTMFHGGAGTNAAFSKIINEDDWSKGAKKYLGERKGLDVGECADIPWPSNAQEGIKPGFLFQVLGPDQKYQEDLEGAQQKIYEAYKNIFSKCREHKLQSVQMPLLSTGVFASNQEWVQKMHAAAFKAIEEEIASEDGVKTIVLVDYSRRPWKEYCEDYDKKI